LPEVGDVRQVRGLLGPHHTQAPGFAHQAIREPDGAISGIMVLGVDVTQRKQAEDAMRTTEKLVAVGRLAASIAHEINNPLEAVTNLHFLARSSTNLEEVHSYLAAAEQELWRAGTVALTGNRAPPGRYDGSCSGVVASQSRSSWSVFVGTASTGST